MVAVPPLVPRRHLRASEEALHAAARQAANRRQLPGTEESLAGRAGTVVLYGLSQGELAGRREDFVDRLFAGDEKALRGRAGTLSREQHLEAVCAGSYPEPLGRIGRRRNAWFGNHVKRIMTRDVQDLSRLAHKLGARFAMGVVLYTGKQPLPFGDRLWTLPYSALGS